MGRRVAAFAVDLALVLAASYVVWFAFSDSSASALLLVPVGFSFVIDVLVQGRTGQTPGKRWLGLTCVVEASGEPAGRARSFVRYVLWLVDGLGAALLAFVTTGHRRVGDMAAGTVVVDAAALERWKAERLGPPAASNGHRRNPYADDQWLGGAPPSAADWGQGP
jgi:uncharacterized RDD family membrane protein YckC